MAPVVVHCRAVKTIADRFAILFENATTPEQARTAVARLRRWRRLLLWVAAILLPVGIAAMVFGWSTDIFPAIMFGFVVGAVLFGLMYDAESRHLAMWVTAQPLPDPVPMTLTWRYGFVARTVYACSVAALFCGYLSMMWTHHPHAIFDIPVAIVFAGIAYNILFRTAWRPCSRASHIADIDVAGLHVLPLGLTVPWDRITGVFLQPANVRWVLDDPDAFIAALAIPAGRRRALRRWLKAHKGGIDIGTRQMREMPTTVHAVSVRLRYEATGAGAAPEPGVM
jgi:hypothetical protein